MKKLFICIILLSMMEGKCFSQVSPNHMTPDYLKGYMLGAQEGKWIEAFPYLKTEADKGNEAAQYQVALCYERGEGVDANFQEAFSYMYKAASGNIPCEQAYTHLGLYYRDGMGCSQNYSEAIKWFRKGAESSSIKETKTSCTFHMGIMYLEGWGVQQDYAQSVYWFRKAAEQGHAVAAHNLGNRYIFGEGVMENEVEAVKWWRKAAELDYAPAQYNMGLVYLRGTGNTPINKSIALQWFKKAAAQGMTDALIEIAELEGK